MSATTTDNRSPVGRDQRSQLSDELFRDQRLQMDDQVWVSRTEFVWHAQAGVKNYRHSTGQ
ncbi:hypothetical protein BH11PSE2_BH11PSE2_19380 [soil metagenome]